MSIGLMIGLASLFYLPLIVFLPIIILILLLFTNTLSRRYVVLLLSGLMPLLTAFEYYWIIHDGYGYFITNYIIPGLSFNYKSYLTIWQNYPLLIPILFFWLLGFITMPKQRRLNNYQNRLAQLLFVNGLLSLIILGFNETDVSIAMAVLLPVAAYFATHLFFIIKRPLRVY